MNLVTEDDTFGAGAIVSARTCAHKENSERCLNFFDAVAKLLPRDDVQVLASILVMTTSWRRHAMAVARAAHLAGVPEDTIRFLVAVYLKE